MTAKAWNVGVLVALLVSLATIGIGVFLSFGLGPALMVFGACSLGCVVFAAHTTIKVHDVSD